MSTDVRFAEHTIIGTDGMPHLINLAKEIVPGLLVYRLPDGMTPTSPHRWRVGHHTGLAVADAMRREDAINGAEFLGTLADWTQSADELRAGVDPNDLYARLSYLDCIYPASQPTDSDVSRNGTYSDDDIRQAAAQFDGDDSLQILAAMSEQVPWAGLDTEPFNEAHARIVRLACEPPEGKADQ